MAALRILYVMDPLARILVDKDTTFAFMLEGERRGHEQHHCGIEDLFAEQARPVARVRRMHARRADPPHTLHEERTVPLVWFDVTFMLNDPRGLREANEKLYALRFPDLVPESLVSAEPARLKAFMESLGGEMILKPLDGCGGAGVFHLHRADRNLNAILELSTRDATRLVMAQRYLPVVREEGDKRLIVLAGEPLGAVRRIPREDEHRGNIHVGGRVERAPVDTRDRDICRRMAERLAADGLYFVGLDVIGGLLTEVNVTSPTGIQEIDRLDGVCLEARVLDFVEARAATLDRRAAAH